MPCMPLVCPHSPGSAFRSAAHVAAIPLKAIQRHEATEKFIGAAGTGTLYMIEKFLARGQNVDARGMYGRTALWLACEHGHLAVARRLLDSGASPLLADTGLDNDTPLHVASLHGHVEIVEALIESGADVTAVNGCGRTPFDFAERGPGRETQRPQLAALLTEAGGGAIAMGMPIITGEEPPPAVPVVRPRTRGRDSAAEPVGDGNAESPIPVRISASEASARSSPSPSSRRSQLVLTAPHGAAAGEALLMRTADGGEYEVRVPPCAVGGRHFVVELPAGAAASGEEEAHPLQAVRATRLGRPLGVPLAAPHAAVRELLELCPPGLQQVDALAAWLATACAAPAPPPAEACRRCAAALVARGCATPRRATFRRSSWSARSRRRSESRRGLWRPAVLKREMAAPGRGAWGGLGALVVL